MRARLRMLSQILILTLLAALFPRGAVADEYNLGAGDHLTLKVLEWRPDRGEPFEWPGFSGDYVIGADGALPLPIVGFVPAAGQSVAKVATVVGQLLQKEAGLANPLQVSMQVVQYRPFYVYGGVERPGEYPYRPGMTVLEAVSIAGGAYRAPQTELQLRREDIEARGAERGYRAARLALLATLARLQAEANGATEVAFPNDLDADPHGGGASLKQTQLSLFKSRQATLQARLLTLDESKRLFSAEIDTLTEKVRTISRQSDLNQSELDSIYALMKKGLTTEPRKIALEENLEQLESNKLDYQLSLIRAQEGIATADRDKADALNARKNDVLTELAEADAKLAQNDSSLATSVRLAEDVESKLKRRADRAGPDEKDAPLYSVDRRGAEHPISVSETDALQPGDVLRVGDVISNKLFD